MSRTIDPIGIDTTTGQLVRAIAGDAITPGTGGESGSVAWAAITSKPSPVTSLLGVNTGDQTSIVGITGTKAQFDTACTDGNFLYSGDVTQYTDEMAQDAIGAMVNSSLVYTDATPLLALASRTLWGQTYDGTGNVSGSQTGIGNMTGGANSMTITAGTGDSRTLTLRTTTSGGVATTALTLNADQSATFAAAVSLGGDLTMGAGHNIVSDTVTGVKLGTDTNQKLGFFNAAPVVQPTAYTQTFATASKTFAALTGATLTDNTGGSADTTLASVGTTYSQTVVRNNFADLAAMVNKETADVLAIAKVVTQIIDDLQALGLLS